MDLGYFLEMRKLQRVILLLLRRWLTIFLITATCDGLVQELYDAIKSMGYVMTTEADDMFISMEIRRQSHGNIFVNQKRHIKKLLTKYNIIKTASTPLPSNFTLENYLFGLIVLQCLSNNIRKL